MKIKILTLLFSILAFAACDIRDGEEYCPAGRVQLNYYAESFRSRSLDPLEEIEAVFSDRITNMQYFLYRNATLYDQGTINNLLKSTKAGGTNDHYTFNLSNLDFGEYEMIIVANCTGDGFKGDPASCSNLLLSYLSADDTEDYFSSHFTFTVDSDASKTYNIPLYRTHGVIRYTFENLPDDVAGIEVIMENVSMEKWITGDYKNVCSANKRFIIPVSELKADADEDFVIGTFPTLTNERSIYHLNLYRDGENTPYLTQMISDTLTVLRNQLLEINSTFTDGKFIFNINLDSEWDGSSSGGDGEIS